jgi:hypothetical protein
MKKTKTKSKNEKNTMLGGTMNLFSPLEMKVILLNSRLQAIEKLFLKIHPESKLELECMYKQYLEEAFVFYKNLHLDEVEK